MIKRYYWMYGPCFYLVRARVSTSVSFVENHKNRSILYAQCPPKLFKWKHWNIFTRNSVYLTVNFKRLSRIRFRIAFKKYHFKPHTNICTISKYSGRYFYDRHGRDTVMIIVENFGRFLYGVSGRSDCGNHELVVRIRACRVVDAAPTPCTP
jgi:hypothetical protein